MNKKALFVIISLILLGVIYYLIRRNVTSADLVEIRASSSLRDLTIDNLIEEAELIVLGEVRTTHPSKWKYHNTKDAKNATAQEIFNAEGLFTDSIISVNEFLKGRIDEPVVRVRTFIGDTGKVRWLNTSEPNYQKGHYYLLFLCRDTGPTQTVDPGDYIAINAIGGVYEIHDGKAISGNDEWILEDLIAYIQNALQKSQ